VPLEYDRCAPYSDNTIEENIVVEDNDSLIALTADIVSAHVSNNSVSTSDVGSLIQSVFAALQALGAPPPEPEVEKPKGAVSARASIKPDHLISMIDGKPYKTLRRHLSRHGYTPESYRDTFGLAVDYPMVAANYAEHRRALAHKIGLGVAPVRRPPNNRLRLHRRRKSLAFRQKPGSRDMRGPGFSLFAERAALV
jgi:predicted transcriptional regulator